MLDTNVWISSLLLPQSIPGRIITAWQHALFDMVVSSTILEEIKEVLAYPKIKKRLLISPEEIDEYLTLIRFFAEVAVLKPHACSPTNELRDMNDAPILETLITSKADYLITGDRDLLVLSNQYPIITPAAFAVMLD